MECNSSLNADSQNEIVPVRLHSTTFTPESFNEDLAPVIFIHGFFSNNRTFTNVRAKISRRTRRRVYVIELRNHGKSEYSEDFTLSHCVADLENFMETSNIPRAVLAGHSMGGRLALAMALKHPDKIEKVIVEDTNVEFSKPTMEECSQNFQLMNFLNSKLKEFPSGVSEIEVRRELTSLVAEFWPKAKARVPLYTNSSRKVDWEFNGDVVIGTTLDKFNIDLSQNPIYTGDTLLLGGELAFAGEQKDLDAFYKHFPNLNCEFSPNVFHAYHVECPELYIKLVSKFIGEVSFNFDISGIFL